MARRWPGQPRRRPGLSRGRISPSPPETPQTCSGAFLLYKKTPPSYWEWLRSAGVGADAAAGEKAGAEATRLATLRNGAEIGCALAEETEFLMGGCLEATGRVRQGEHFVDDVLQRVALIGRELVPAFFQVLFELLRFFADLSVQLFICVGDWQGCLTETVGRCSTSDVVIRQKHVCVNPHVRYAGSL